MSHRCYNESDNDTCTIGCTYNTMLYCINIVFVTMLIMTCTLYTSQYRSR